MTDWQGGELCTVVDSGEAAYAHKGLTAKQLIKHLKNLPPETEVFLMTEDGERVQCQYSELQEYPNR